MKPRQSRKGPASANVERARGILASLFRYAEQGEHRHCFGASPCGIPLHTAQAGNAPRQVVSPMPSYQVKNRYPACRLTNRKKSRREYTRRRYNGRHGSSSPQRLSHEEENHRAHLGRIHPQGPQGRHCPRSCYAHPSSLTANVGGVGSGANDSAAVGARAHHRRAHPLCPGFRNEIGYPVSRLLKTTKPAPFERGLMVA